MEEFIQFILKNFYIVLFVLFILSRLMGKSGGKRGEPRIPNFGGEEPSRSEAPPKERERAQQQMPDHRGAPSTAQQTVYRSRLETSTPDPEGGFEVEEHDPYADEAYNRRRSGSKSSAPAPSAKPRPSFASLGAGAVTARPEVPAPEAGKELSKRELRNAFIWSEVLGPPKAKRNTHK